MRILAIDGGGMRGIIPAFVLQELERRTGRRTAELFDFIAGTSTGGIIALAAALPGPGGAPRLAATEMVHFYRTWGPRIFTPHHFGDALRVVEEKYPAGGLEVALDAVFGETLLSEATVDVLVTTYDARAAAPVFLRRSLARSDPAMDLPMSVAARATSAAPTYFPPLVYRTTGHDHVFLDGGVVANNPAITALAHAAEEGADAGSAVVVSLGTGAPVRHPDYEHLHRRGLMQWAGHLFTTMSDAAAAAVDHHAALLIGPGRYHRFQTPLAHASVHLDDSSDRNIEMLIEDAQTLIAAADARLDTVAALLTSAEDEGLDAQVV